MHTRNSIQCISVILLVRHKYLFSDSIAMKKKLTFSECDNMFYSTWAHKINVLRCKLSSHLT